MKIQTVLFALALGSLAMVATAQPPVFAPLASMSAAQTAKCLDRCFKDLTRNLSACRRACWVCDYSVLGICLSGHHSAECLEYCEEVARDVHAACVEDCGS